MYSGYFLEVGLTGFDEGLDMEYERKNGAKLFKT